MKTKHRYNRSKALNRMRHRHRSTHTRTKNVREFFFFVKFKIWELVLVVVDLLCSGISVQFVSTSYRNSGKTIAHDERSDQFTK